MKMLSAWLKAIATPKPGDQALRPELANVDAEDALGGAGRVDTYI
jgi:hypothetical protein